MSRRRQRTTGSRLAASDSDDDAIISASAPASSHGARLNPHPAPLERRSRARVAPPLISADDVRHREARQWHRDRLPFGLPDFLTGLGGLFAFLGIPGAHGDGPLQRNLAERMQLFRPEMSSTDKRHLIDATTIVCTHNSTDELQCGICLQTLDQGTQLRMAQCCHKFHDECLTEWFKSHLDCPQCRVKLSEMMDSMKSVESGGKSSSCNRAMGSRERVRAERIVIPEGQASSSSSSMSGGSSSNSSSGNSVARQQRFFMVARGSPDEHLPVAVEHRWPLVSSSGDLHFTGVRGFGGIARNVVQSSGGSAANDPIVIDDPSPSASYITQDGLQVFVLSSDSE